MRKIIAAAAAGLALIAGQAVAANGAAQSLQAGDRVSAALGGEREDFWILTPIFGTFGVIGGIIVTGIIGYTLVEVVDQVVNDDDDSPS